MVAEPIEFAMRRRQMGVVTEVRQEEYEREPAVAVPLVYFQMLKGDARAATFLAQVLYHQKYKGDHEGWFYHTQGQWEDELGFSDDAEGRCCKTLASYGLETSVRAVNRTPKKHYRVNEQILQERITEHLHLRESRKCQDKKPIPLPTNYRENELSDIYGKVGSVDISENAVNDTSDKMGSDTSEKVGSALPRKSENIIKRDLVKEIDPRDRSDANASLGAVAVAPNARRGKSIRIPKEKSAPRPRAPDPYWDALVALCGPAEGRETVYGMVCKAIKEMGGTPEEIPIRAANWHRLYPNATRTIHAIHRHWHDLAPEAVEAELARKASAKSGNERGAQHGKPDRAPATAHHESDRSDIF